MRFMSLAIVPSLLMINVVSSTTFYVTIGKDGACDYDPQFLTGVKTGDSINFEFDSTSADHVIESEQYQLCLTSNFDALTNAYPSVWTTTIADATPSQFYCTFPSHCPYSRKAFTVYPTDREAFQAQENIRRRGSGPSEF